MTLPLAAPGRVRALQRMKFVATGLLVVAAAVFVVCVTVGDGKGAWGYIQATAEASMVGGLADWFAVTALFRHPLGIPVPHTAIVPRKKDQIGAALASFVEQHFLTAEIVGERLAGVEIPRRLGEWLAEPAHAARLAEELGAAVGQTAGWLRDDELRDAVMSFIDRKLHEVQLAPVLARTIEAVCDSGQHQVALTALLRGLSTFLDENRAVFRRRVAEESPEWVPNWVDERVFNRAFTAGQAFVADLIDKPDHELRAQFDKRLRAYAEELRTNPVAAAHAEQTKAHLLDHPDMHEWLTAIWTQLRGSLVTGSTQPRSELQRTVASLTVQLGQALGRDPALRAKIDDWISAVSGFVLTRYSDDIAGIISSTIERWDSVATSRRIEIQVGRDLQFIRVNGTVVGALVGVVIYAISQYL
jgi:uncharacterized membrane-anchored protein YjiN (DUF445 family)